MLDAIEVHVELAGMALGPAELPAIAIIPLTPQPPDFVLGLSTNILAHGRSNPAAPHGPAPPDNISFARISEIGRVPEACLVAAAGYRHLVVTHSADEFVVHYPDAVRPPAHINTAESLYNDLRHSVMGIWHWLSEKRLDRYLPEITWRRNHKKAGHLQRIAAVLTSGAPPLPFGHPTA